MSQDFRLVECAEHGPRQATYVCRHLVQSLHDGRAVGFFCAEPGGNPRPDAWCASCEARLQRTGGEWTEESEGFAGVTLLCAGCYDRVRELNSSP